MKMIYNLHDKMRKFGDSISLDGHERRKLGIFNLMNFFGLAVGLLIPLVGVAQGYFVSIFFCWLSFIPALICMAALTFNYYHKYELARICFFTIYPLLFTCIYALKLDLGSDFFFIAFGVVSVFFLQSIYNVILSFSLSMTCYFLVHAIWNQCTFRLETVNYSLYQVNHLLPIFFIFYGLFLIRNENNRYQLEILNKNGKLLQGHRLITLQQRELTDKAALLQQQTTQLTELNFLKNKLFSVVAHDLKGPLFALHMLFKNMDRYDLPADEIKTMIPEVVKDLAGTTYQMESILNWVKSQMEQEGVEWQILDISKIIHEVLQFLHLQVEAKRIHIEARMTRPSYISSDKQMVALVLRNLISNAIKFTPEGGTIILDTREDQSCVEVFVEDTGMGIRPDTIEKLIEDVQYSTPGTADEQGTGLGLMLCKEFLSRNGGRLNIQSTPGKGSIFSFTLPKNARQYENEILPD
jgi:two-component system sensor histidine kinase/response regulator